MGQFGPPNNSRSASDGVKRPPSVASIGWVGAVFSHKVSGKCGIARFCRDVLLVSANHSRCVHGRWTYTAGMSERTVKQPAATRASSVEIKGTLNKSVFALAIEPLNMSLTVTARKAYDVMLWIAQRSSSAADGGYSSAVSAILRGYGSNTKASERIQQYIEQMVQTAVVWRPLASSEQRTLSLEGFDSYSEEFQVAEARTFPLLAEARLYKKGGEAWVTWYYPPSISEQLLAPERWAQIELNSIARLSTYTAVALYEICARYKDSPGGLTSRQNPDFWIVVLREGGGLKPREYRKFKNELLLPAVEDICRETEIEIELVEHRDGGRQVSSVQFKVRRKSKGEVRAPELADVSLVMRASKIGIRETDFDVLVQKFGADRVAAGLTAMDAYLDDKSAVPILNRFAYLKRVLLNMAGGDSVPAVKSVLSKQIIQSSPAQERKELEQAWLSRRVRQLRSEFAALSQEERNAWIDQAAARVSTSSVLSLAVRKRLVERDWESPLISTMVLEGYASAKYGNDWRKPSDMDLMMFSVEEQRN